VSTGPVPALAGRLCTLRKLVPGDAAALQRHADDPAVAHNLFDGFPQPYTLELAQDWCGQGHLEPQYGHVWGIEVNGEIAGCISVAPQGGIWRSSAVMGYWLGQAHWRRGITSEALGLATDWAWARLAHIQRLWMPIYARNTGSRRVALRAGYVQESFMPYAIVKAGQAIDGVNYAAYRPGLSLRPDTPV
jgi:[ribosomal protein S5]-alanine N-acetyltransferase